MKRSALAVVLLLAACGGPPGDPARLRPPSTHGRDVMYRQRLTIFGPGDPHTLDVVLQRRGDVLTLLALTPFGTRAFSIEQHTSGYAVHNFTRTELPIPARRILIDVQRILAPAIRATPLPDGTHQSRHGRERVSERWRSGRLLERTFTHEDRSGAVRIDYGEGMLPDVPPSRIEYANPWSGYRLRIETLEHQTL